MESTPPSHRSEPGSMTKSSSRLQKIRNLVEENGLDIPQLSLDIVPSSPHLDSPSPTSTISPRPPPYTRPLHELLLLSPSPLRKSSKSRLADRMEQGDDAAELIGARNKRCKGRSVAMGISPRNTRRSRRRLEQDLREEKDLGLAEDLNAKPRRRKHSGRASKKDKHIPQSSIPSPKAEEVCNLDRIGKFVNDLIMWKDVSKSSLWFGFGSICFLSSCFARGLDFSFFSMISQLGLLFLVVSFFSNSIRQRDGGTSTSKRDFKLKEDDILRVTRLILPAANLVISTIAKLFSGEPAMTLKVVPFLLLGSEYGHFITLWRLCALGFFFSFTGPKLYSSYSGQISKRAECLSSRVLETWEGCSHKKALAGSAITAFWNLSSIRTRILAAFICLVLLKCYRQQNVEAKVEEQEQQAMQQEQQAIGGREQEQHELQQEKAIVRVEADELEKK